MQTQQQQLGGQEGVCTSEVTVTIKSAKEKRLLLGAFCTIKNKTCTMQKMTDDDDSLSLDTRRSTALLFF